MSRPVYESDIPTAAEPRVDRCYLNQQPEAVEYWLKGERVGRRVFDEDGRVQREEAYRDGRLHGREYEWTEGSLRFMQPWVDGLQHGTAWE